MFTTGIEIAGVDTATPRLLMVHTDHLRRPIRLTDMSRATVWQASYDPFGLPLRITGTVEQNLRFPGQYFLLETGLAYNWHRLYDPATGSYTQPDPLRFVDGPSVYGYAGGSPLMRVDPEGLIDGWTDPWSPPDMPLQPPGPAPVFPYDPGYTGCDQYPGGRTAREVPCINCARYSGTIRMPTAPASVCRSVCHLGEGMILHSAGMCRSIRFAGMSAVGHGEAAIDSS